jgi:hypothetical protein
MITVTEPTSLKGTEKKSQSEQQLLNPDSIALGFHPKEDVGVSTNTAITGSHSSKVSSE